MSTARYNKKRSRRKTSRQRRSRKTSRQRRSRQRRSRKTSHQRRSRPRRSRPRRSRQRKSRGRPKYRMMHDDLIGPETGDAILQKLQDFYQWLASEGARLTRGDTRTTRQVCYDQLGRRIPCRSRQSDIDFAPASAYLPLLYQTR